MARRLEAACCGIAPPLRCADASPTRCCRPTATRNGRCSTSRSRRRIFKGAGAVTSAPNSGGTPPLQNFSSPALVAKRLRADAGLLAEEPGEMRRVREGEIIRDLVDRLVGEDELAFSLSQHALPDEVAGGDPGGALDVVVEAVR